MVLNSSSFNIKIELIRPNKPHKELCNRGRDSLKSLYQKIIINKNYLIFTIRSEAKNKYTIA